MLADLGGRVPIQLDRDGPPPTFPHPTRSEERCAY